MRLDHPVIVFDGYCALCSGFVNALLRLDRRRRFYFAALQSPAGQELLHAAGLPPHHSEWIMLIQKGRSYGRSAAVLRIARGLGLPWSLLYGFWLIPRPLRDAAYGVIARNRYRWFGKRETCRVATDKERERFLE